MKKSNHKQLVPNGTIIHQKHPNRYWKVTGMYKLPLFCEYVYTVILCDKAGKKFKTTNEFGEQAINLAMYDSPAFSLVGKCKSKG